MNIRQKSILIGSMLGDGSLTKSSTPQCAFREGHSPSQLEYLRWKFTELQPYSCSLKLEHRRAIVGFDRARYSPLVEQDGRSAECWVMRTWSDVVFGEWEKEWYLRDVKGSRRVDKHGRRIKCVPPSIRLDPLSVAVWFMDDGTNLYRNESAYKSRNAILHTLSFTPDECNLLCDELRRIGVRHCKVRLNKKKPEIVVLAKSFLDFMDMIADQVPCEAMKYKVTYNYIPPKRQGAKLSESEVGRILTLKAEGVKQKDLSRIFCVSQSAISNIVNGVTWKN